MFEEQGYERTTVRDIAAAAQVTERTFFRYFPFKEDLVLSEITDMLPTLQEEVRSRPADEPPLTAVLQAFRALLERRGEPGLAILLSGPPARFTDHPSRTALTVLFEFETGLATVLAERLTGTDDAAERDPLWEGVGLRASVLARTAVAALRSAIIAHADMPEPRPYPEGFDRLLRDCFAALES